jgi:hypothetical protein
MEISENEKIYNMNLIEDAISVYEKKKESLSVPIEEHIKLVMKFSEYIDMLNSTHGITNVNQYKLLFTETVKITRQLSIAYNKHGEFNFTDYYVFCKIVQQMMDIILTDKQDEDDLSNMFTNIKI